MNYGVTLLHTTVAHWSMYERLLTVGDFVSIRNKIAAYPFDLTEDQKILVTVAGLSGLDITDPLRTLSQLPPQVMRVISYTFCAVGPYGLRTQVIPQGTVIEAPNNCDLILTSATLYEWYAALNVYASGVWSLDAGEVNILKQILRIMEQRGLKPLFSKLERKRLQ